MNKELKKAVKWLEPYRYNTGLDPTTRSSITTVIAALEDVNLLDWFNDASNIKIVRGEYDSWVIVPLFGPELPFGAGATLRDAIRNAMQKEVVT